MVHSVTKSWTRLKQLCMHTSEIWRWFHLKYIFYSLLIYIWMSNYIWFTYLYFFKRTYISVRYLMELEIKLNHLCLGSMTFHWQLKWSPLFLEDKCWKCLISVRLLCNGHKHWICKWHTNSYFCRDITVLKL